MIPAADLIAAEDDFTSGGGEGGGKGLGGDGGGTALPPVDTPLTVVIVGSACPDAENEAASAVVKTVDAMRAAAALDGTGVATVKLTAMPPACMRWRPELAGAFAAAAATLVMLTPVVGAPIVVATAEVKAARAVVLKVVTE